MIDDAKSRVPEHAGVSVLGIRHAGRRSLNRPVPSPALRVPLVFSALKCCEAAWPTLVRPLAKGDDAKPFLVTTREAPLAR